VWKTEIFSQRGKDRPHSEIQVKCVSANPR
jgi:hypothetical protein